MPLTELDYDRTDGDAATALLLEEYASAGATLIVEFCPCGCVRQMSEGEIIVLGPDAAVSLESFHANPSGTLVLHSTLCATCRWDERDPYQD